MERRHLGIALLVIASISQAASADFGGLAIAGRSGTLGFGGELMVNILPTINGRFGVTYFPLGVGGEIGDVNYDFDLRVLTFPLTMDWYPFKNGFHISGGAIFNQTTIEVDTGSTVSVTINDHQYSASEFGTIHGEASFQPVAPYVGIGWGNAFGKEKRWGILTDLGVAFLGRPSVSLTPTGQAALSDAAFMADLAREQKDLEDDLSILKFYPVLSASLFFRF
jgi:hypothetical protein